MKSIVLSLLLWGFVGARIVCGSSPVTPLDLMDSIRYDGRFDQDDAGLDDLISEKGKTGIEICYPATKSSFKSFPAKLELPSRPGAPVYTIDFFTAKTRETVGAEVEYAVDTVNAPVKAGSGEPLKLVPGENLRLRIRAAGGLFPSKWFLLSVPEAPDVSRIAIDFRQEKLTGLPLGAMWKINAGEEKFVQAGLSGLIPADESETVRVQIYVPASQERFASAIRELTIPARPVISLEDMNCSLDTPPFAATVHLPDYCRNGNIAWQSSDAGIARIEGNDIVPVGSGKCTIMATLEAGDDYFASLPARAVLEVTAQVAGELPEVQVKNLILADGRTGDTALRFEIKGQKPGAVKLTLFNITGKVVYRSEDYHNDYDLAVLQAGTYYYVLSCLTEKGELTRKGFVEVVK